MIAVTVPRSRLSITRRLTDSGHEKGCILDCVFAYACHDGDWKAARNDSLGVYRGIRKLIGMPPYNDGPNLSSVFHPFDQGKEAKSLEAARVLGLDITIDEEA